MEGIAVAVEIWGGLSCWEVSLAAGTGSRGRDGTMMGRRTLAL